MAILRSGRGKDANEWIMHFLLSGEKTFGEIKKFLETKGILYYDNKGLALRLEDLISKQVLGKHKLVNDPHPSYFIQKPQLKQTSFLAQIFANNASRQLLSFDSIDEDEFTEKTVRRIGFYTFYIILEGLKQALESKSSKKQIQVLNDWLENALPMNFAPTHFHLGISHILDPSDEEGYSDSPFSKRNVKKLEVNKLELTLRELYPEEMKICSKVMRNLKKSAKRTIKIEQEVSKPKKKITYQKKAY